MCWIKLLSGRSKVKLDLADFLLESCVLYGDQKMVVVGAAPSGAAASPAVMPSPWICVWEGFPVARPPTLTIGTLSHQLPGIIHTQAISKRLGDELWGSRDRDYS